MMGQLYVHTQKAVRVKSAICIAPADRVFLVVGSERGLLVAWKCTLVTGGLEHPAFKAPLPLTSEGITRGCIRWRAKNGSEPTALFRPDSFYRLVSVEQLTKVSR